MIHFIVTKHHACTREAMTTLPALASKVARGYAVSRPEVQAVERLVHALAAELFPHMLKEETGAVPLRHCPRRGGE